MVLMRDCEGRCDSERVNCFQDHGLDPGKDYGKTVPAAGVKCNNANSRCKITCKDDHHDCPKCPDHECPSSNAQQWPVLEHAAWGLGLLMLVTLGALCVHRRGVFASRSDSPRVLQAMRAGTRRELDQLEGGQHPLMLAAKPASAGPPICAPESSVTDELL